MGSSTSKSTKNEEQETENITLYPKYYAKMRKGSIRHRYRVSKKIGQGSSGSVYKVMHLNSRKVRAMKIIPIDCPNSASVQKLLLEVSKFNSLGTANFITVYDVYQDETNLAIVSDLCRGEELFDRMVSQEFITENQVARYLLQIGNALGYLCSLDIVHGDLKPENLLFETSEENSNLKLVDFGFCKYFTEHMRILERVGTPYYMAPEVISGDYQKKSDVWSLGVILYVMLSGRPPFNGNTDTEILMSIMNQEPKFDGKIWKEISLGAIQLIRSMLTRDLTERYFIQEVLRDQWLQEHANNLVPDKILPTSLVKRLSRFSTANKLQRATMVFIANKAITIEEITSLRENFSRKDKIGNGVISRSEMAKVLIGLSGDIAFNEGALLEKADKHRNGRINYNEFLTTAADWERNVSRERLKAAFKGFNSDGSGRVSITELVKAFGGEKKQSNPFIMMVKEVDSNDDKEIDLEELCNLMKALRSKIEFTSFKN